MWRLGFRHGSPYALLHVVLYDCPRWLPCSQTLPGEHWHGHTDAPGEQFCTARRLPALLHSANLGVM